MNYILIFIYYSILSTLSVNSTKPKLCIDCKFFRNDFFAGSSFGKCSMFPIQKDHNEYDLVTGAKRFTTHDYSYCSTSRKFDDMCGKDGKLYEKKKEGFLFKLLRISNAYYLTPIIQITT